MEQKYIEQERYDRAAKRVKQIKSFFSHALVYVVINIMIIIVNIQNLDADESYYQWQNFFTLIFWGIGLLAHGLTVFLPAIILGKNWEERKIQEFMNKDKKSWK